MKKTIHTSVSLLLAFLCVLCLASCGNRVDATGLWEDATYTKDTELGKGSKTFTLEVAVEEQTVTLTVHTDAKTVGAALLELELIEGDEGDYGLYIKKVNGMTADYDTDKSYWSFYVNGEYAMTGVDGTTVEEGATYRLVREQ